MGFGYKDLVFCKDNGWVMENTDKELTLPNWAGTDKSAENTPNAHKIFGPIYLPKPKSLGFSKKRSPWVSVVRALKYARQKWFCKKKNEKWQNIKLCCNCNLHGNKYSSTCFITDINNDFFCLFFTLTKHLSEFLFLIWKI